jgi:dienelactone hydrolase
MADVSSARIPDFSSTPIRLENGLEGSIMEFESGTPASWSQIITRTGMTPATVHMQLFLPSTENNQPVVFLIPGSTGINRTHVRHANSLTSIGIGACIVDSFGSRGITHTYHDQRQLTFSAGTYDLLRAAATLMHDDRVNAQAFGAMGPSRGGTSVLQAAMTPLAESVLGRGNAFRAVLPMYPSGIFQFMTPHTGKTSIRITMGDSDKWTLLSATQGYYNAIRLCGGDIELKVWRDAEHSFDRPEVPLTFIPDGVESTRAPVYYLDEHANFYDLYSGKPNPSLTETELRAEIHERFGHEGCTLGSKLGQPEQFTEDMLNFFRRKLLATHF